MADLQVNISFAGKRFRCRPDTSVAVALWENGIRQLSHSPKYGNPRGVTCARGQCTACLMRVDGIPNVRVCETTVREGMVVERQDTGAFYGPPMQQLLAAGDRFVPVGFYFKWFTRPAALSRFFLKRIRPLAGIGRLPEPRRRTGEPAVSPTTAAPSTPEYFDTVVVGAGPAGLRAATAVATSVRRVLVVDDHAAPGGQRNAALATVAAQGKRLERFPSLAGLHRDLMAAATGFAAAGAEFRGGHKAVAGFAPDGLVLRHHDRLTTVRAGHVIWAAGALDQLGLFPGNDAPGVFGPRALYRLLTRDGLDVTGKRVLVIGGGLDFWLSAALLATQGANLNLVVEDSGWQAEISAAVDQNWQLNTGLRLSQMRTSGPQQVQATFVPRNSGPGAAGSHMHLTADLAVICRRGKPAYDIPYQLGADLQLSADHGGFVAQDGARVTALGEAAGQLPEAAPSTPSAAPRAAADTQR